MRYKKWLGLFILIAVMLLSGNHYSASAKFGTPRQSRTHELNEATYSDGSVGTQLDSPIQPSSPTTGNDTLARGRHPSPSPLSPFHRERTTDRTPTFTWTQVPDSDMYRVRVYTDDLSYDVKQRTLGEASTSTTWEENLAVGRYLWRVRAREGGTQLWSGFSIRFTLFVD
jgi:hypothetical protein